MTLLAAAASGPAKAAISPRLELGAYEALWDKPDTTFKTLSEKFAACPDAVPSDFVSPTKAREYADFVQRRFREAEVTRFGVRVRHGERERNRAHERDVREVIANAGAGRRLDLQPRAKFLEHGELVLGALKDMHNAELAATDVDHLRLPTRDHRHLDPGLRNLFDAQAVTDVKQLQCLTARTEVEAAVGHNTVDVQHQHTNGGRGFSWHERWWGRASGTDQTTPAQCS